jgi:PKD repeat protein
MYKFDVIPFGTTTWRLGKRRVGTHTYEEIAVMKRSTMIALAVALVTTFALTNASAGPPPPIAGFSADLTNGLTPLTVAFSDASTGFITNWSWNFGDNVVTNMNLPTANLLHTYETPGTYTVQLTVTGPTGFSTLTRPDYITVIPEPSTFLLVILGSCLWIARRRRSG